MIECVLVVEDESDAVKAALLVDRSLVDHVDWVEGEQLAHLRCYRGIRGDSGRAHRVLGEPESVGFTLWKSLKHESLPQQFRVLRRGIGGDALAALKATALAFMERVDEPFVVLLVRDSDGDTTLGVSLATACEHERFRSVTACVAVAHPEIEAWQLNAFEPADESEHARLAAIRQDVGFDPRADAHRLNPGREHDPRTGRPIKTSTKRILKALAGDDADRQTAGLRNLPLATLVKRGAATGLSAFLADVRTKLAPLIGT